MKKLLSLMLAAAICLSLCPFAFAEDTVEIEMWSNMYGDELTALIEEYQAAHPNVKVNLLLISFWDFDSKLIPALAAGTAPDLFIGSLEFSHAADELALRADITDLVNAKGYDASRYMTFAAEACQEEGRVYGLPFATDTRLFYYNKDMFAAAGLDPETPPASWADVLEYTKKLTTYDEKGNVDVLGFHPALGNMWPWTYLWTWGVKCLDENGFSALDNPATIEAANMAIAIQDVYGYDGFLAYKESTSTTLTTDPFIAGKLAMTVSTHEMPQNVEKYNPELNFGTAVIPTSDGVNNHASWSSGFNLQFTNHGAARLEAAVDFGLWLTSDEIQTRLVKEINIWSCNNAARAKGAEFHPEYGEQYWNAMEQSATFTHLNETNRKFPGWAGTLYTYWNEIFNKAKTPQEAIDTIGTVIKQEIENYDMFN